MGRRTARWTHRPHGPHTHRRRWAAALAAATPPPHRAVGAAPGRRMGARTAPVVCRGDAGAGRRCRGTGMARPSPPRRSRPAPAPCLANDDGGAAGGSRRTEAAPPPVPASDGAGGPAGSRAPDAPPAFLARGTRPVATRSSRPEPAAATAGGRAGQAVTAAEAGDAAVEAAWGRVRCRVPPPHVPRGTPAPGRRDRLPAGLPAPAAGGTGRKRGQDAPRRRPGRSEP